MNKVPSFNSYIEKSILSNWDRDALTDYKGATLQFHDVARKIEKLHILFENSGIQKGDKIALCGRNSSHWAVAFLATLTYGAVIVPIQHEFTTDQVYNIVNHSESKLLFVGDVVATSIDSKEMPNIEGIVYLPDFSVMESRTEALTYAREHLNEMFGHKYPKYFRKEHVKYHVDSPEELAMINYTSGTTGFSKGVMLPYRALWGNLDLMMDVIGKHIKPGSNVLIVGRIYIRILLWQSYILLDPTSKSYSSSRGFCRSKASHRNLCTYDYREDYSQVNLPYCTDSKG